MVTVKADNNLGKALNLVRVYHNMSQRKLAEQLGVDFTHISKTENGINSPSLDLLERYATIFDIPASSLLLFSEKLNSNDFSEHARVFVADKVLKLLDWIVASKKISAQWNESSYPQRTRKARHSV
ncbi:MAG: helix-turn-helix transcriptional regulator [Parcubacteria group bacterium]|nr:helix-turn-helix transcriptional regulator [Parcubacteria group bacterium]